MQNALSLLFPEQCIACGALVETPDGLCGACWRETPFLDGLVCDACGLPLLGEAAGARPLCDGCLEDHPPWSSGRAVVAYRDTARRLVLALKHGDRLDLARPLGRWMAGRGGDLVVGDGLLVPVPLHWTRLVRRRFNQSALLASEIARCWGAEACPDGLIRTRRTRPQDRMTPEERRLNVEDAITPHPRRGGMMDNRNVVLVDDVMTSGATLAAAARAARAAGARSVSVLVLARVVNG